MGFRFNVTSSTNTSKFMRLIRDAIHQYLVTPPKNYEYDLSKPNNVQFFVQTFNWAALATIGFLDLLSSLDLTMSFFCNLFCKITGIPWCCRIIPDFKGFLREFFAAEPSFLIFSSRAFDVEVCLIIGLLLKEPNRLRSAANLCSWGLKRSFHMLLF